MRYGRELISVNLDGAGNFMGVIQTEISPRLVIAQLDSQ